MSVAGQRLPAWSGRGRSGLEAFAYADAEGRSGLEAFAYADAEG